MLQDWCLSSETHEGSRVLQRFQDNLLAAGAKDRVVVLQQSSSAALADLFSTHLNAFDVRQARQSRQVKSIASFGAGFDQQQSSS